MTTATPVHVPPGWTPSRVVSLAVAVLILLFGLVTIAMAVRASLLGICDTPGACGGGGEASPFTGVLIGSGLAGIGGAWALRLAKLARQGWSS